MEVLLLFLVIPRVKEQVAIMYKWILKDDTVLCLCEACSKKDYKNLVIRQPWRSKDKGVTVTCERCGKSDQVDF